MPADGWLHSPEPPGPGPRGWPRCSAVAGRTPSVTTGLTPASGGDAFGGAEVPSVTVTTCSAKPWPARCNPLPSTAQVTEDTKLELYGIRYALTPTPKIKCPPPATCCPSFPQPRGGLQEGAGPAVQPQASTSGPQQTHCQRHQPGPLAGTGLCSNRAQTTLLHINSAPAASADTIISVHNSPQCGCCHSFSFIFSRD